MALDYLAARALLDAVFDAPGIEAAAVPAAFEAGARALFRSPTQSYREVLLGCVLVRLLDPSVNVRKPYVNQGEGAFNGRSLDERVVNPFLHDRLIPATRGPYLASFRRSVTFVPATAAGQRDKPGYAAFLDCIDALEAAEPDTARAMLHGLLRHFAALRDASHVPVATPRRLAIGQQMELLRAMLRLPSGGLVPVLVCVAMLETLKTCFRLTWTIEWQGINVADTASGASGDITISDDGRRVLVIEVTERPIDRMRVVGTAINKVLPGGLRDYLFLHGEAAPAADAVAAAQRFFGQGHELTFMPITAWIEPLLVTVGAAGRDAFIAQWLSLLSARGVPARVKLAWNEAVGRILQG